MAKSHSTICCLDGGLILPCAVSSCSPSATHSSYMIFRYSFMGLFQLNGFIPTDVRAHINLVSPLGTITRSIVRFRLSLTPLALWHQNESQASNLRSPKENVPITSRQYCSVKGSFIQPLSILATIQLKTTEERLFLPAIYSCC